MLCPESLAVSISAAAVALSKGKNSDEIGLLGAIFSQLGDTLSTISAQKDYIENRCGTKENSTDDNSDTTQKTKADSN